MYYRPTYLRKLIYNIINVSLNIMKDFSIKYKWTELLIVFSFLEVMSLGRDGLVITLGHCSSWIHIFVSPSLGFSGDRWLAVSNKWVEVLFFKQATSSVDSSCIDFLSSLDTSLTFWCFLENSAKDSSALSKVEWCWICCRIHLESPKEKVNPRKKLWLFN